MKKFHITGPCLSHKHYMADTSAKLKAIVRMIEDREYFVINRPRQYGKTTMMYAINHTLQQKKDYLVIPISFEGVGDLTIENEAEFCQWFFQLLSQALRFTKKELAPFLQKLSIQTKNLGELSNAITDFIEQVDEKIVLLIDEVDQSSKSEVFLRFLGVLRDKYIKAQYNLDFTFHNVILVGVHNIKNLKMKIRSDSERHLNSPWNIAAEFKVEMSFLPNEIAPMLEEYVAERGVQMDVSAIAQQLYDYTSGYPFLVSKLCKVMDEELLPQKKAKTWTKKDLAGAVHQIVHENNVNFDSLIKNLERHKDLYRLVFDMLVEGIQPTFSIQHSVTQLGFTYGVLKNGKGITIHNRIYEQIIYNYMVFELENTTDRRDYGTTSQYILPNRQLDMDKVVLKFQQLMKEQYSEQDQAFLERNGRLVFVSFLKPIINGKGHVFLEPQISEEKRLDIVITFYEYKYIIELKLWYGSKTHDKGLLQLADYLDRQNQDKGWLVIFEHRRKKTWGKKAMQKKGKEILGVWV